MDLFKNYEDVVIEHVCRICLMKNEKMSTFSEISNLSQLLEIASIQLTTEDNAPYNLICAYCTNELNRCHEFRKQIVRSFEIGRWLIKQQTNKELQSITSEDNEQATPHDSKNELDIDDVDLNSNESDEEYVPPQTRCKSKAKLTEPSANCDNPEAGADSTKPTRTFRKKTATLNLTCEVCQRKCPTANALMRHKKVHKETKDYVCTKCGKAFKQSQTLADHMKRHYDLKKYACEICGKRFYKQYNVTMHMRMHTGEKPYKCTDCDKAFTRPLLLRNHIKQVNNTPELLYLEFNYVSEYLEI